MKRTETEMKYVLDRILEVWKSFPQMRLMQLLVNSLPELDPLNTGNFDAQLYYREDTEVVQGIHDFRIEFERGLDEIRKKHQENVRRIKEEKDQP